MKMLKEEVLNRTAAMDQAHDDDTVPIRIVANPNRVRVIEPTS